MLIADGGGGRDGTDWAGMSIDMMRTLIQNPNIEAHYKLLTGWQRSYELVSDHLAQVIGYRDNLMVAWPPEKSPAAAAYRDRLNDLIANLNATYEASIANHDAFASATLSLSLAQHDFEEIWQEHEANKAKLAEYQNDLALSSAATFDTTPPVTSMQQEAVRQKAIALMSSVSSDLAQSQAHIVRPSPYLGGTGSGDTTKPFDGSTYSAPLVPPITPTAAGDGSSGSAPTWPSQALPGGPGDGGITAPKPGHPGSETQQPGLVLGGTTPAVAAPSSAGVPPISSPLPGDSGPGRVINPAPLPGTNPFLPSSGGAAPPPGRSTVRGVKNEGLTRPGAGIGEGLRAMPPGGLIGGTPAVGLGQPGSSRPSTRRVNPIGGVIGEGESNSGAGGRGSGQTGSAFVTGGTGAASSSRGTGRAGRGLSAPDLRSGTAGRTTPSGEHSSSPGSRGTYSEHSYGQTSGRRSGRHDESETSRWDPDDPWKTAEGVDPVVLPPKEQRIDPGPAIGLS